MNALAGDYYNVAAANHCRPEGAVAIETSAHRTAICPSLRSARKASPAKGRIAREVGIPTAKQLEELANQVVDFAKHRVERGYRSLHSRMASAEHIRWWSGSPSHCC